MYPIFTHYEPDGVGAGYIYNGTKIGQTFIPKFNHTLKQLTLKLKKGSGGSPGTLTFELFATSGGLPIGSALSIGTTNGNLLTTSLVWTDITMTDYSLLFGVQYAIVMSGGGVSSIDAAYWGRTAYNTYLDGTEIDYSGSWSISDDGGMMFKENGLFLPKESRLKIGNRLPSKVLLADRQPSNIFIADRS